MESSAFAGAPAVSEELTTLTEPTPQVEPTPAAPEAPVEQTPTENPVDPVLGAISDLKAQVESLKSPPEPETPAMGLLEALQAEPEEPVETQVPETAAADQLQGPAAQQRLEDLERFVDQRADARVAPIIRERQEEKIAGLQSKYPDITSKEVLGPLGQQIDRLISKTGNENLLYDADVVEMAYKAVKAELADTGAVSAEQAANSGASLETNAGQSQAGDPSPDETYRNAVFNSSSNGSVFG
jgi:hypothetical protein